MKVDRSITHNGREYVSVAEFTERVNSTRQTITSYIRQGILKSEDVQKNGNRFLDWTTESVKYRVARSNKNAKGGAGRKKKNKSTLIRDSSIKTPSVSDLNIPNENNDMPDINVSDVVVDISKIDIYENKDCWLLDSYGEPLRDSDGKPRLDYDRVKAKYTAQTYQVRLGKESGSLIPQEQVIDTCLLLSTIYHTNLDLIPAICTAQIVAKIESHLHIEISPELQTEITNILENIAEEGDRNIQIQINEAKEKYANKQ